jgi:hypothetical protein
MEGKKFDQGKPPLGLVPGVAIREIAKVLQYGATKYDRYNWLKGMKWSRLYDAALRHIYAWIEREECDEETSLSHLAHAGCCIVFLITYEKLGLGEDDRYNPDKVKISTKLSKAPTCEFECTIVDGNNAPRVFEDTIHKVSKKELSVVTPHGIYNSIDTLDDI